MPDFLSQPWPWYVAGPLIGLVVPALLLAGGKAFGLSSNFRHICAAVLPNRSDYFRYDWKAEGSWSLLFIVGMGLGGAVAVLFLPPPGTVAISAATRADLAAVGVTSFTGLMPSELFSWPALTTPGGWLAMVVGGFLVGFGTRYANGCTSGHAITGLANLQPASLLAVCGFFLGGLVATWFLLPLLF